MPINFVAVVKAVDAFMALRAVTKRLTGEPPPADRALAQSSAAPGLGPTETRLTNVVVAALKEAFERDRARLEVERAQLDEQRRRAEEAVRLALRRQAIDRELGRLRMLAATALAGWVASVLLLVVRLGQASVASRVVLAVAWLLLVGALAAAFTAQGRMGASAADPAVPFEAGGSGAAVWLVAAGLAAAAASLLL